MYCCAALWKIWHFLTKSGPYPTFLPLPLDSVGKGFDFRQSIRHVCSSIRSFVCQFVQTYLVTISWTPWAVSMKLTRVTTSPYWWLDWILAAWCSGNGVGRINEVTLRRARSVLGWVTLSGFDSRGRHFISVCNQPPRSTHPFEVDKLSSKL